MNTTNTNVIPGTAIAAKLRKYVYAAMLHSLTVAEVRSFWDKQFCGTENDSTTIRIDFYRQLWDGYSTEALSMTRVIYALYNTTSTETTDFTVTSLETLLEKLQCTLPVAPPIVAKWVAPHLPEFLAYSNPYEFFHHYASVLMKSLFPAVRLHFVTIDEHRTDRDTILITETVKNTSISTVEQQCSLEFFLSLFFRFLPRLFGLHPFKPFIPVADPRTVDQILPGTSFDSGRFLIGDTTVGRTIAFKDWLHRYPELLFITNQKYHARPVVLTNHNICFPGTNFPVMRKACCYNAPFGIFHSGYRTTGVKPADLLPHFITTILCNDNTFWNEAQQRHLQLTREIQTVHIVRYHKNEKCLTIDNRRIATMAPAAILAYLFQQYTEKDRTEFEYREFLHNTDCTFDIFAPNLSVRVKRLTGLLAKKFPLISICPTGRGRFTLTVNGKVTFEEF